MARSAHPGAAGSAFRRDRQVSRAGLGALSVTGDIRAGRPEQGKFSPCPGGRRYDLSLRASETHHPSPGRRALCFFGRPPTGRAQQSASRKALNLGPLHASALLPRAPSSSRSLLPTPFHSNHPRPQTKNHPLATSASPTVRGSQSLRPPSPVPPAVTGSCEVRERGRRLQLSGRPGAPGAAVRRGRALPTCGGGGVAPSPHPHRVQGRRSSQLRRTLMPWLRGWHSRTFWMTACREEAKRTRAHC